MSEMALVEAAFLFFFSGAFYAAMFRAWVLSVTFMWAVIVLLVLLISARLI